MKKITNHVTQPLAVRIVAWILVGLLVLSVLVAAIQSLM